MLVRPRLPLAAAALAAASLWAPAAHADGVMELIGVMQASRDYKQRVAAAIGLARLGDVKAVPALIAQLEDKHHTVRGVVAAALGKLGDARALAPLRELRGRDSNAFVRKQIDRALGAIALAARHPHRRTTPPTRPQRHMRVSGTTGTLDPGQIQATINSNLKSVTRCFNAAFQSKQYLGGSLMLHFRVNPDGSVRSLRLERSHLGSLSSERCITDVMRRARFDRPSGGEADFTVPLKFGGGVATRELSAQSPVARALEQRCRELLRGTNGAPPGLVVTAYVKRGRVVSAGLASADGDVTAAFAQRFVANLKRVHVGYSGAEVAKLSYRFKCGQ